MSATIIRVLDNETLRDVTVINFPDGCTPEAEAAAVAKCAVLFPDEARYQIDSLHGPSIAEIVSSFRIRGAE